MSTFTVRRRLCEACLYGRIAVKKPLLRKQNNVKRLQTHKDQTIEQWNKVFWINESKFKIFGSNKRVYVWQRVGERAVSPCITPPKKHGRGSVIVWGTFVSCKIRNLLQVKGKLNQISYHSILQHHMISSGMWLVGQGFVLMQDNNSKHTSKLC